MLSNTDTCSIEEYLAFDQEHGAKYEYRDGYIVHLDDFSDAHIWLTENLFFECTLALRSKNSACRTMSSQRRLYVPMKSNVFYPDMMVVCGEVQYASKIPGAILNPTVIVEVLSSTTEGYDRGKKFEYYRSVPTLREYVLINQDRAFIEWFYLQPDDVWQFLYQRDLETTLELRSIDLRLPMDAIYSGVDVPDEV